MLQIIAHFVAGILSYALALAFVLYAVPQLGFQMTSTNPFLALLLMGCLLWILFTFVKRILGWVLLPFHILTLGLFSFFMSIFIHVLLLYVFVACVSWYGSYIHTSLVIGNIIQVSGVAFLLSIVSFTIRKVL